MYEAMNARRRVGLASCSPSSNDSVTISRPRSRYFSYSAARNGASSWQFGHQLPLMLTMTTLPANFASVLETVRPSRSANVNRNGSASSATLVWCDGSVGVPMPTARSHADRGRCADCQRRRPHPSSSACRHRVPFKVEAREGLEPSHHGFADRSVAASPPRLSSVQGARDAPRHRGRESRTYPSP